MVLASVITTAVAVQSEHVIWWEESADIFMHLMSSWNVFRSQ